MRLICFLIIQLSSLVCFASGDTLFLAEQTYVLDRFDRNNYDDEDYNNLTKILEESKASNYHIGVLRSCLELIHYFSNNSNIDSVYRYQRIYEAHQKFYYKKDLHQEYLHTMGHVFVFDFYQPEYALPYFLDALKHTPENDHETRFSVTKGLTDCYIYKGQYELAIQEISKVLKDSNTVDVRTKNSGKLSLAIAYQFLNMPEMSGSILKSIIFDAKQHKDSTLISAGLVFYGHNLFLEKKFQESIDLLNSNFVKLDKFWPEGKTPHYEFLAMSYGGLGHFQSAIEAMVKATLKSPLNELPRLFDYLSEYHIELGMIDSALHYSALKNQVLDSIKYFEKEIYSDLQNSKLDAILSDSENKKIRSEQIELSKANQRQKSYIISLILSVLSLIFGGLFFIHYRKQNASNEKLNSLKEEEKNNLQNQIKYREDELSAMLIGQESKMKGLKEIRDQLYTMIDENSSEKLKKQVKKIDSFVKESGSENVLTDRLESQYPGLVLQLKTHYPQLSKTNIKHCLLIKLGFSIKESAEVLNVTPNTVKTARYRAKVKLGLSEDMSLGEFLSDPLVFSSENKIG